MSVEPESFCGDLKRILISCSSEKTELWVGSKVWVEEWQYLVDAQLYKVFMLMLEHWMGRSWTQTLG